MMNIPINKLQRNSEQMASLSAEVDKVMVRYDLSRDEKLRNLISLDVAKKKRQNMVDMKVKEFEESHLKNFHKKKQQSKNEQEFKAEEKHKSRIRFTRPGSQVISEVQDPKAASTALTGSIDRKEFLYKLIEDSSKGIAQQIREDTIRFKTSARNFTSLKKFLAGKLEKEERGESARAVQVAQAAAKPLKTLKQVFEQGNQPDQGSDQKPSVHTSEALQHASMPASSSKPDTRLGAHFNPSMRQSAANQKTKEAKTDLMAPFVIGSTRKQATAHREPSAGFDFDSAFNIEVPVPEPSSPRPSRTNRLHTLEMSKFSETDKPNPAVPDLNHRSEQTIQKKQAEAATAPRLATRHLPYLKFVTNPSSMIFQSDDMNLQRESLVRASSVKGDL